jgi:hypothetical protein
MEITILDWFNQEGGLTPPFFQLDKNNTSAARESPKTQEFLVMTTRYGNGSSPPTVSCRFVVGVQY